MAPRPQLSHKYYARNHSKLVNLKPMIVGTEWLIEASGCEKTALRDENLVRGILDRVIADLGLKSIGSVWHKFEGEGGVTGLIALTESHLACHTYPEHGTATFNLYCCQTRPEWDWEENLTETLGAENVSLIRIERGGDQAESSNPKSKIENRKSKFAGGKR